MGPRTPALLAVRPAGDATPLPAWHGPRALPGEPRREVFTFGPSFAGSGAAYAAPAPTSPVLGAGAAAVPPRPSEDEPASPATRR